MVSIIPPHPLRPTNLYSTVYTSFLRGTRRAAVESILKEQQLNLLSQDRKDQTCMECTPPNSNQFIHCPDQNDPKYYLWKNYHTKKDHYEDDKKQNHREN